MLEKSASGKAVSEIFSVLLQIVEMRLEGIHAAVFLLDKEGDDLLLYHSSSFPSDLVSLLHGWSSKTASSPPADAMARGEPVFVADIDKATEARQSISDRYRSAPAVWILPLRDTGCEIVGALSLHGHFAALPDPSQLKILENVTRLATVAVSCQRTESALRENEVTMRRFYDNVKDVLFEIKVTSGDVFSFGRVNRSFLEATGLSEDMVVGKPVKEVIPEPSYSLVVGKYKEAIRYKRTVAWQEITPYPSGVKTGEVSVAPIFNEEGQCMMLVGTVHDITDRKEIEDRLRSSEEMFRLLFETSRNGIILMTTNSEYLRANSAAVEMFGCDDEQQLLAMQETDRVPEFQRNGRNSKAYAREMIGDLGEGESAYIQWTYKRRDGVEFVADVMFARITLDGRPLVHITVRDITEQIETVGRLERITRLYAALSECSQAIIQCEDEQALLDQVCSIAVEFGGMRMAWVGMRDPTTHLLVPAAYYGDGIDYLKGIEVSTDGRKATGKGPGGTAFRKRRPVWCQDFMSESSLAAWHERGRAFDWKSVAALPLERKGEVVGIFLLYSSVLNAFDEEIKNLLLEMSAEISFGLGYMQDKHEREVERTQLRRLSQVVQQSHNMVMITDIDGRIEYVNPAFERVTGYGLNEIQGKNARFLKSENTPPATFTDLWSRLKRGDAWQGEIVNRKKDGTEFINLIHAAPLYTLDEQVTHYLSVGEDMTEHRHAEWRVEYLANFDDLTGLPNRVQLQQQFGYAISAARRSNENLALMFVDLDLFKNINDALGHSAGDILLKEIANRLKAALREEDVICRLGGDEFIVMLPESGADAAAEAARKILAAISEPCKIEQHEFEITGSVGIAIFPQDGSDLETLSKNADMAMFLAKQEGRGCYRFYTEEMQIQSSRMMLMIGEMRHAIAKNQFDVQYQPLISGEHIIGVEALLRWNNPILGQVSPTEFIPAAEESGLITDIGEWVLQKATEQARAWLDSGIQLSSVAVNLSPVQFRDERLSQTVVEVLEKTQLPPEVLELEITEGTAMLNPDFAVTLTKDLNMLGVRFSIDDFGTGYSSLSYLKKFHIHKLKIDRTFVRDLLIDAEDRAIVSTIINMARSLGLVVIAEGVENEEQRRFLADQGCDEMQGFYFSKPLFAAEFESFVQHWNASKSR